MKRVIFILLGLLLLAGCTTTCPAPQCPSCNCGTQEPAAVAKDYVTIDFIDVGQGDSTLIDYGDTEMLIDCGKPTYGDDVVAFLKSRGVTTLEYLVITHPDSDHIGGCYEVLSKMQVTTVIQNGQSVDTVSYKDVQDLIDTEVSIIASPGLEYNIGPAKAIILQANNANKDTNQNSIVIKLVYGTQSVLFAADCDKDCETLLLDKGIDSTILRVPHHGTKFGSTISFLEKVTPQIAIISVGDNNYGHPAPETLDRLSQEGIIVYRTDLNGNIQVKIEANSYVIS